MKEGKTGLHGKEKLAKEGSFAAGLGERRMTWGRGGELGSEVASLWFGP